YPPKFLEVALLEDIVLGVANALRVEVNKALEVLRLVPSCFVIFDLEPLSLSLDFVFSVRDL
ncbi:hypothetical protein Tco_1242974, partial [Tanacetum coccineum]